MELRKLMRAWGWNHGGVSAICQELGFEKARAADLLRQLIAEGYVEEDRKFALGNEPRYIRTLKGGALAGASAVGVQEAAIFGSYLSDVPTLGDLDIHYVTYRKIEDGEEFMRVTGQAARESGRPRMWIFSKRAPVANWRAF